METSSLQRIHKMEERLNRCSQAVTELAAGLDQVDALREDMGALFGYYGSEEWFRDREEELPPGTRAGVLSEDAVYDTITQVRCAAFRMLELATDLLKNHI